MGSLTLPPSGLVYVDTAPIIYSIEKNPDFYPLTIPLWQAAKAGQVKIATSALALLETLVVPIRQNDAVLIHAYEQALTAAEIQLIPITSDILREAADCVLPPTSKLLMPFMRRAQCQSAVRS